MYNLQQLSTSSMIFIYLRRVIIPSNFFSQFRFILTSLLLTSFNTYLHTINLIYLKRCYEKILKATKEEGMF